MNHPRHHIYSVTLVKSLFCWLLVTLLLPATAFAQPKSPARWLFVFDLSGTMKKRLPATEEVISNFFATGAEGRLQDGDNIGVWTYNQKLHMGQFPLTTWGPGEAMKLTTNLTTFLHSRTYVGDSQLAALQPTLGNLIADSERLTIVIFSAGDSDISGTPYDRGISQNFQDGFTERKKSQQPFVVLIRTLSGKYIGCTVNFPPGEINIPLFFAPAPPPMTNPPPALRNVAAVKPTPAVVPDLIINGNTVVAPGSSSPPPTTLPVTNPPPAATTNVVAVPAGNPVSVPAPVAVKTSTPAPNPVAVPSPASPPASVVTAPTNTVAIVTNPIGEPVKPTSHRLLIVITLIVAVVIVVLLLVFRPGRRPQASLISSSMQNDPRRK